MNVLMLGSDPNALACALTLAREGHRVQAIRRPSPADLLPASPLAPELGTLLDLGATLQIVGRVGINPEGATVTLKLREISGEVSQRDRERWRDFVQVMNNASELWRGLFESAPGTDLVTRWREFGRRQAMEVLRVPCQSLCELLDDWFESDLLKATLAATALRGARGGPFAPGSAFLLLQRWARGEVFGRDRTESGALTKACEEAGVEFLDVEPAGFQVFRDRVTALSTTEAGQIEADLYLTSEDPVTTLRDRVGVQAIDPDHAATVARWDNRSTTAVAKVSVEDRWEGAMVNFCRDLRSLEKAYDPTKYGEFSEFPFAELDTQSGTLYVQHVGGEKAEETVREFCQAKELGEVSEVLSPSGIEARYGAAGGHLFGGEKWLWQSYALRESLRNPLTNLYLCGAGTGPGDHSGVSGLMCARLVRERQGALT